MIDDSALRSLNRGSARVVTRCALRATGLAGTRRGKSQHAANHDATGPKRHQRHDGVLQEFGRHIGSYEIPAACSPWYTNSATTYARPDMYPS